MSKELQPFSFEVPSVSHINDSCKCGNELWGMVIVFQSALIKNIFLCLFWLCFIYINFLLGIFVISFVKSKKKGGGGLSFMTKI